MGNKLNFIIEESTKYPAFATLGVEEGFQIIVVNNLFATTIKYSKEELLEKSAFDLIDTNSISIIEKYYLSDEVAKDAEFVVEFISTDNTNLRRKIKITPFEERDDSSKKLIWLLEESEQLASEKREDFSVNNLDIILHNLEDGVLITDANDNIVEINQRLCQLVNTPFPTSKLINKPSRYIFEQLAKNIPDSVSFLEQIKLLSSNNEMVKNREFCLKGSDWLAIDVIPFSMFGNKSGNLWFFKDITSKKHGIELRLRTQSLLRSVIDNLDTPIWIIDKHYKFADFNSLFLDLVYDVKGIELHKNSSFEEIFPDMYKGKWKSYFDQVLSGETFELDKEIYVRNVLRKFAVIFTPLVMPNKEIGGIICIAQDRTLVWTMREELEKTNAIASQNLRSKEQFLSHISHEMLTSVNAVFGISNILKQYEVDSDQKKLFSVLSSSADNLRSIVNDILDYSKIESGKFEFVDKIIELSKLVSNAVLTLGYQSTEKMIPISINFEKDLPKKIIGDATRLSQILINLLSNAIKYSDTGKILVDVKQEVDDSNVKFICFSVIDEGIGIPEDKLNTIFEKYERVISSGPERQGTGLGLAIVKNLVSMQGGKIAVESKLGVGSKFTVKIPLRVPEGNYDITTDEVSHVDEKIGLANTNVLVAEDNELNQLVVSNILKHLGVRFTIVDDGNEVIKALSQGKYDIILMDLNMPYMDGYTASKHIRMGAIPTYSEIPIIALTATVEKEVVDKIKQVGINDYLSKPFGTDSLRSMILKHTSKVEKIKLISQTSFDLLSIQGENKITSMQYLFQIGDGDITFILDMIDNYIMVMPSYIEKLTDAANDLEFDRIAGLVHKIKPAFQYMGIQSVSNALISLERNAGASKNIDRIMESVTLLSEVTSKSIDELNQYKQKLKSLRTSEQ